MKLSKETQATLKNFSMINSGIVLSPGNFIMTKNINGSIYAEATIEDTIDEELAIYDLNGFLNLLSMVGDAEITKSGLDLVISNKTTKINWPLSDKSAIVFPANRVNFPPASIEFELKGEDYSQLTRVSRAMGIDTVVIKNEGGKLLLAGHNFVTDHNLAKPLYTLTLCDYDGPNNFAFTLNMSNMKFQPDDYTVQIYASSAGIAAQFITKDKESKYVVSLEKTSVHDF